MRGVITFSIKIIENFWIIYSVNPPTFKFNLDIKSTKINSLKTEIRRKYCFVFGDLCTEISIHDECILGGSVLTITTQ